MSTRIEINGKTFVSIKEAVKQVSYSRDYLAKLAREQKVIATQVGRQWFIDLTSLKSFAEASALEQELRKKNLRRERKQEREAKQKISSLNKEVVLKKKNIFQHSLVFASLVLVVGVSVGTFAQNHFGFNNLATPLSGSSLPKAEIKNDTKDTLVKEKNNLSRPSATTVSGTEVDEYPLFEDKNVVNAMSGSNPESGKSGIFLLTPGQELKDAKQIANLFSDPVEVKFVDTEAGVVVYKNQKGEVKEFPFASVPPVSVAPEANNYSP